MLAWLRTRRHIPKKTVLLLLTAVRASRNRQFLKTRKCWPNYAKYVSNELLQQRYNRSQLLCQTVALLLG